MLVESVKPKRIQALAERLADSMVSRSYLPSLWLLHYLRFLEIVKTETKQSS
jgi:hypothetical protein